MTPAAKHIGRLVNWDGGLAALLFTLGWGFLQGKNFLVARIFFTASFIFLALKGVSETRKFESAIMRVIGSAVVLLASLLFWVVCWFWVFHNESPEPKPEFLAWLWFYIASVTLLPFRRILNASFIVILVTAVVLAFIRERQARCPDKRLHWLAERDKASIKEYVWVTSIYYQPAFDKGEPYIDFVFWIFNNSLFDIVIKFQDGFILYGDENEQFHFPPKFIAQTPARCWSRSRTNFVIRQGIMQDAITRRFGKPDNIRISFGNLKIKFVVEQFPEMDAVSLDVNHYLQTAEHAWRNPNRPEFFGPQEEHLADLTADTGEALTQKAQIKREVVPRIKFLRFENTLAYKDDYGRIARYENKPRTATWREKHPSFWILVAYYRNQPQKGQKPSAFKKVSAELTYKTNDGPFVVPRALWFSPFSPNKDTVDIGYNEVVGFILAGHRRTGSIYSRDENHLVELAEKELTVSIRFLSGADGSIIEAGSLKIESIKKSDGFDFRVTEID